MKLQWSTQVKAVTSRLSEDRLPSQRKASHSIETSKFSKFHCPRESSSQKLTISKCCLINKWTEDINWIDPRKSQWNVVYRKMKKCWRTPLPWQWPPVISMTWVCKGFRKWSMSRVVQVDSPFLEKTRPLTMKIRILIKEDERIPSTSTSRACFRSMKMKCVESSRTIFSELQSRKVVWSCLIIIMMKLFPHMYQRVWAKLTQH